MNPVSSPMDLVNASSSSRELLEEHLGTDGASLLQESLDAALTKHRKTDVQKFSKLTVDLIVKSKLSPIGFTALWKNVIEEQDAWHKFQAVAVLSDGLHQLRFGPKSANTHAANTLISIATSLPNVVENVAKAVISSDLESADDDLDNLGKLLSWWDAWGCFSPASVSDAQKRLDKQLRLGIKASQPWQLPSMHGEQGTPWYDLPAATFMKHIKPNSTQPIRTRDIRPIQLRGGNPEPKLLAAVESLIQEAKRSNGDARASGIEGEDTIVRIDKMGQKSYKNAKGQDVRPPDTYYGWSPSFCEQMTARKKYIREKRNKRSDSPGYDRERDLSRGRRNNEGSRPPRRRRSSSYSSRSRSGSRSRSYSRNRSSRRRDHSSSRSPSRSPSRSRSTTRQQPHTFQSRDTSNGGSLASFQGPRPSHQMPLPQQGASILSAHPPPLQPQFNPFHIPPQPPHHVGPWPPPPPPLPLGMNVGNIPPPGIRMQPGFIPPPFPFPQLPPNVQVGFPPPGMPNIPMMPFQGGHMSLPPQQPPPPPPPMNGPGMNFGSQNQQNGRYPGQYDHNRH